MNLPAESRLQFVTRVLKPHRSGHGAGIFFYLLFMGAILHIKKAVILGINGKISRQRLVPSNHPQDHGGEQRCLVFSFPGVSISSGPARCKMTDLSSSLREQPFCKGQRPDTYGSPTTLHRKIIIALKRCAGIVAIKRDELEYSLWAGMPEQYPMKG
jgi:hypothetical protein